MDRDKVMVIICVTIIYGLTVWMDSAHANQIILPILTGIFGMTTGSGGAK